MKILVTGGAGRLGRSTLAALSAAGHEVVSVDRATAPDFDGRQVDIDLAHPTAFSGFVAAEAPDAIVHLAAIAVPFSAPEGVILDTNSRLAFTVLDAAREHGVARVLAASSPTVMGYGSPTGWEPDYLPLDEEHRARPWNAYALSKQLVENLVAMFARQQTSTLFGAFRPCFVISPGEWSGEPTQQGHTVVDRLNDPSLAAVSLFNYVDARDAADFVVAWVERAGADANGEVFFVGAADALALAPLSELLPYAAATGLDGTAPAFSSAHATDRLGWAPTRSWRTELPPEQRALLAGPDAS
ncbi:NAD(P)-dependent oxidoreductase [Conyzicola nivalis]|uniref:UDP-glucose 4-epimerase n=1 Tax=Conyzicola nivalis TaxID=1477021 RepID=A0A916SMM9_9MICO|nr:NAD(P)-dependent oxidoreductase [Conyzicola nivalis]GGB07729.1 UDP-glucose 4-epimerase [Conyzicola nivalis]